MDYAISRIQDAENEPVSLVEAKAHLRVADDITDDDSLIKVLITAARNAVEREIQRPIGEQVYEMSLRYWPYCAKLTPSPLLDVTRIAYMPYMGTETVLFDSEADPPVECDVFRFDTHADPGELWLLPTKLWPVAMLDSGMPVRIRYKVGIIEPPVALIHAIKLLLATWYENRESIAIGRLNQGYEVPDAFKWLCQQYQYEVFG